MTQRELSGRLTMAQVRSVSAELPDEIWGLVSEKVKFHCFNLQEIADSGTADRQ